MNNFKYAFFAITIGLIVSGCSHRGNNPYDVKTQNKQVYVDMPINRIIYVNEDSYDDITTIIDNDSNERIKKIIGGNNE